MTYLSVESIRSPLKKTPILKELTFQIPSNSINLLIGPNGSGKTTLLKTLCGLISYEGDVWLQDKQLKNIPWEQLAKQIVWIPNNFSTYLPYTVEETILLGRFPWNKGFPSFQDKKEVISTLDILDINHLKNKKIPMLSSGECQKVNIARAYYSHSPLVFLDEPSSNLDLKAQFQLLDYIKILKKREKTILYSEHNFSKSLHDRLDRVIALKNGQIHFDLPAEKAFASKNISNLFDLPEDFDSI